MRRAAKVDDNQKEIVETFRKLGWSVRSTAAVSDGFPDLAIGKMGYTTLVEIKDGRKPPSARKLTDDQVRFWENWKGSIILIQSVDDVIEFNRKRSL